MCPWPCSSVEEKDDEQSSVLKTESSNLFLGLYLVLTLFLLICKEMKIWKSKQIAENYRWPNFLR